MASSNSTMFAPAKRANAKSIMRDAEVLQTAVFAEHVVRVLPFSLMILNRERQVVYMNQRLMDLLHASSHEEVLGKRPGELLHCIHAYENNAGCGTTKFCRECGAIRAILKSQENKIQVSEECRITSTSGDAYDLRAWASPYTFEGRNYTFFSVEDIQQEKRRHALERTFFHDVNNPLSAIVGCADLMGKAKDIESVAKYADLVQWAGRILMDEIESHKRLLHAENKELSIAISTVQPLSMLREVVGLFSQNQSGQDRNIVVNENSEEIEIATDRVLLRRVLRNMLKNALEATSASEEVCLSYARDQSSVVFNVHNPGSIPHSVQLQLFQRSFSTKGKGRGIGTYSMKLFGERYLKGKVWFSTSEEKGTTFSISIPITYEA
ncbi:MAG: HAMP domain-containing sensor histidine kinase [Candidatus Electrothrix sp. Rat3]|nr:HAMP domain-containing sensor histidine kinase [Candidatus Electrothrix rattekaaiensis]